jgi:chromosomal replication initiation ATPase DnaA
MEAQLGLFAFVDRDQSVSNLLISEPNRDAWDLLTRWESWPGRTLVLVGPSGSGKSHMAAAWLSKISATHAGALVLDDAEHYGDDAALAFLLDQVRDGGGPALLIGRRPPSAWVTQLPDLHSRLLALPVATVGEPDEQLLRGVLERLCKVRFIKLSDEAGAYLARHMDRSFEAAHALVDRLDKEHTLASRPVSVKVAARALRALEGADDGAASASNLSEDA